MVVVGGRQEKCPGKYKSLLHLIWSFQKYLFRKTIFCVDIFFKTFIITHVHVQSAYNKRKKLYTKYTFNIHGDSEIVGSSK